MRSMRSKSPASPLVPVLLFLNLVLVRNLNLTQSFSWIRRGKGCRWRRQEGGLVVSCPLSPPGPCSCTAMTAASPRSWWQG